MLNPASRVRSGPVQVRELSGREQHEPKSRQDSDAFHSSTLPLSSQGDPCACSRPSQQQLEDVELV